MNNLKTKTTVLSLAILLLISPLLIEPQSVYASAPNSTAPANDYCYPEPKDDPELRARCCLREPGGTYGRPAYCQPSSPNVFAAAQTRNARNISLGSGLRGGDSATRSNFSFLSSILVLLGGIWALLVLLRQRFDKRRERKRVPLRAVWELALKPSFALSIFGFLFVAAIVGSALTAPTSVTAEKPEKPDKRKMIGLQNPSNKPVFKSAQQIGSSGKTQIGAPVFDSAGNRYVRGGFTGTLTIGATTLTATKDFDLFVAKYDAGGNALWARKASGATGGVTDTQAIEGATALSVDTTGNVYIGGSFVKTLNLQGGANPSAALSDNGAAGINFESFVAKYDPNGNLLWARGGNSGSPKNANNLETGQNAIDQIVFDGGGNLYVAGFVSGTNFLGSPTAVNGQSDILLAKLNPATGAVVWKQVIGGSDDDNGLDLKIDGSNNLYLTGNFSSPSITFPNGAIFSNPNDPSDPDGASINAFVAKFDQNGANLWTKDIGNTDDLGVSQTAVSGAGDIILTGYFFDSATFGATVLTEGEGGNLEDDSSLGGYVAKMNANGDFVWAESFGGIGESVALDGGGRIYVAGTFFDGGTFGDGTPNAESLASFGGADLFVARYGESGDFDFAKAIAGSGTESEDVVENPSTPDGISENDYNPLGIAYNPFRNTMFVSGDFRGAVALDCQTLQTSGASSQSYVAELSRDDETTSCRIWNGLDEDDNDWDSPDNWNGGVLPSPNDSVYVPYTGNNFDAPDFNPATDQPVANLVIADDRILTLGRDLTVGNRLDLLGGYIDADNFTLSLGASAQAFSINDGRVLGKVRKQFSVATNSFTFPVGTENGYSPVTLSNISGNGSFSVIAYEGTYPNTATNLPANRVERWWNLTNGGLNKTDLTFQYVESDIIAGTEADYRAFRIPAQGGAATHVNSSINIANRTVSVPNVIQFSDWTLAQIAANARTIAGTAIYGITPAGPTTKIVPSVALSAVGAGSASAATTDFDGAYQLGNLNAGGEYTVTPSKTGDINGITPFDATLVLRCIAAGTGCQLTSNQKLAADTNNSGDITPFDATQILRFVAANGQTAATGQVGNWKFNLPFIFYNALNDSLTNENYTAILVGEVSGDWTANVSAAAEMKQTVLENNLTLR